VADELSNSTPSAPKSPLCSIATEIRFRRWGVGPAVSIPITAFLDQNRQVRFERTDGQPIGDLAERYQLQLATCHGQLLSRLRELRVEQCQSGTERSPISTSQVRRKGVASPVEKGDPEHGARETPSSVFTVDQEQITDRINRLRNRPSQTDLSMVPTEPAATPAPMPITARHAHLKPEQREAAAAISAMRDKQWKSMRTPLPTDIVDPLEYTPIDNPTTAPEQQPEKRTSSVFRYDRETITDRIKRVRSQAAAKVENPQQPPAVEPQPSAPISAMPSVENPPSPAADSSPPT